jgi:hypothetical protein
MQTGPIQRTLAVSFCALGYTASSMAQSIDQSQTNSNAVELQEVVVTAERRAGTVQSTPPEHHGVFGRTTLGPGRHQPE